MKNSSIRNKLTRSYMSLILALVLLILTGFIATILVSTIPSMTLAMESRGTELKNRIHELALDVKGAANAAFLNLNELDRSILLGGAGNQVQRYNKINQSLYLLKQIYSDIDWIFFMDLEGNVYGDNILLEEQFRQNFDSTRHLTLEKNYGQTYCFGLCQETGISETEPVLLVGKLIRQMDTLEKAGYLYVAVDQTHLQTLYGEQKLTRGQQVYVCGQNGAVLSSSQENMIGENLGIAMDGQAGSRLIWRQGALWMCQKIPMDDLQAEIVILIPFYELYSSSILSVLLLLAATVFGTLLALWQSSRITRHIVTPLQELAESANQISSGDMEIRCQIQSNDEIGLLANSFNHMLDEVNRLIFRIQQEQQEKWRKEMELQQNRIRPHFLYNTLNTIGALSAMNRSDEAARMSKLTAKYYRLILSGGKDIVSVEQELKNIETYLEICKISRQDAFTYTISCSDAALAMPIPKMTIQPLVENAVLHGFRGDGKDLVSISFQAEGTIVTASVVDNGYGIDPQVLEKLRNTEDCESYGLRSVRERLRLMSGQRCQIKIQSEPCRGTRIDLQYDVSQVPKEEYSC